jgi:hypothetical protein
MNNNSQLEEEPSEGAGSLSNRKEVPEEEEHPISSGKHRHTKEDSSTGAAKDNLEAAASTRVHTIILTIE